MKYLKIPLFLAFIFFLALLICVLYNITVAYGYTPSRDASQYQQLGFNLNYEHRFGLDPTTSPHLPTVNRAPLWPMLIGFLSLLVGRNDFFVRLFLCVLDAGTCVLIALFVRDLFDVRIALLGGILAACYPGLYTYTGWLYSEALYTFLLFSLCYTLYRLQTSSQKNRLSTFVLAGLLLGAISLVRPSGLLFLGLSLCWLLVMGWQKIFSWRYIVRGALTMTFCALILIAPWTIRNASVAHSFVPISTGDGTVLLGAYNDTISQRPFYDATWINPLRSSPQLAESFHPGHCAAACEVQREAAFKNVALHWIQAHFDCLPSLLIAHVVNMWWPVIHEADAPIDHFPHRLSSQIMINLMRIFSIPVFLLALTGLFFMRNRWRELLFLYLVLLSTIGQCLIFYGVARFRAPIEPILIILATATLAKLWQLFIRKK